MRQMLSTIGFEQKRTYASKPVRRSSATTQPVAAPARKTSSPPSAASVIDAGWKGALHVNSGYSFKQGNDLEKTIRELGDEVTKLSARVKDRTARVEAQERQIVSLKNSAAEAESKLLSTKAQARKDLQDQKSRHALELGRLAPRVAENKAHLAEVRRNAEAPLLAKIGQLEMAQKESRREIQALRTLMEDQQKQYEAAARSAYRTANAVSRDVNIALEKAKKELADMKRRKLEDREDYTRYHSVFADLNDKIFFAHDEVYFARRRVEDEVSFWKKSARDFKASANLRLFLHSSRYLGTKTAIEEFLQERTASAQAISDGLRQMDVHLFNARSNMQLDAHNSRHLTRHHQLDEHQSAYNSALLAHSLAAGVPFEDLRRAYAKDIEYLEKLREESFRTSDGSATRERLTTQIQELQDQRKRAKRFLVFFGYLQELRALQALRDDDIVEKAVWVDTIEAKQALDNVVYRFHDTFDSPRFQDADEAIRRRQHHEDVRLQRAEFNNLIAQVRQRHLLAHDLGKMEPEEKARIEETINRRTELAKRAVDGGLAGLGFLKSSPRRQARFQKRGEDSQPTVATTIETTSKTSVDTSSADIHFAKRRSQARRPGKKKRQQFAASADRKVEASKPLVRKHLRPRRPLLLQWKQARVDSSSEATGPGTNIAAEAKVKGTGLSGLKPTEPRQAQWKQAAYDPEAGVQRETSRGESMSSTSVKDALVGAPPSSQQVSSREPFPAKDKAPVSERSSSAVTSEAGNYSADVAQEQLQTVLSYSISPKDYRDAAMASPNSNAAYWSHTLYKNENNQKPVVYYCQSYDATEARAKLFLNEPVIGFDLEWEYAATMKGPNPDIKKNVSLIQIACEDKIGLFQLARFRNAKTAEEHLPPSLRKILESVDIVKAGVNINGDAKRLKTCLGVDMQGVFELSHLFRLVKQSKKVPVNFSLIKLSQQVQDVLLLPLKKDAVRISAWSKELNMQQTSYAAADAYAGFQLFHKLEKERKAMVPMPPRPAFYETFLPIVLGDGTQIFRSSVTSGNKKNAVVEKKNAVGEVVGVVEEAAEEEEDEEEEEEFFEAPEGIETHELGEPGAQLESADAAGARDPAALLPTAAPGSATSRKEILYPSLPVQDSSLARTVGTSTMTPAQSRTVSLPLRAKLIARPNAPEQHAKGPASAEETTVFEAESLPNPSSSRPGPVPCPENQAAETWIITYRAKHPGTSVATPYLRAYHLWHHQRFELKTLAGLCRDPPLFMTTVASYIMTALKEGDLPYDGERVRGVLEVLPESVRGRYRGILEKGGK